MKALSMTQPWASLVAIGAKRIETRSWSTHYRGPIAIHAGRGMPADARLMVFADPVLKALNEAGIRAGHGADALPTGVILAVATLMSVEPTESIVRDTRGIGSLLPNEFEFGDYGPRRFGWLLTDVWRLRQPIPCKGALGLWTVPPGIEDEILRQREAAPALMRTSHV